MDAGMANLILGIVAFVGSLIVAMRFTKNSFRSCTLIAFVPSFLFWGFMFLSAPAYDLSASRAWILMFFAMGFLEAASFSILGWGVGRLFYSKKEFELKESITIPAVAIFIGLFLVAFFTGLLARLVG